MKLFLSHAGSDLYLAKALRLRLEELSDDLSCFLFADDVFAGDDWERRIRAAAEECDGIISIASDAYVDRPWFIAEWAAFWVQRKTWYLLLYKVDLDRVFAPMQRRQAFSLLDWRQVEQFLETLPVQLSGSQPLDLISAELVKAVAAAEQKQVGMAAEANLRRLEASLQTGSPNVDGGVVDALSRAGRLPQVLEIVARSDNSVALRQLASALFGLRQIDAARTVSERIMNNAERRTVGLVILDSLKQAPEDSEAAGLLLHIYELVRDPQRRDLETAARERGIAIEWPQLASNP